jgi:hypothetical protein
MSERSAKILLKAGEIEEEINVKQLASAPVFKSKQKAANFEAGGGTLNIELTTNISDWTFEGANGWCHLVKKDRNNLAITVDPHSGTDRTVTITLSSAKLPSGNISIIVTQKGS